MSLILRDTADSSVFSVLYCLIAYPIQRTILFKEKTANGVLSRLRFCILIMPAHWHWKPKIFIDCNIYILDEFHERSLFVIIKICTISSLKCIT